MLNPALTPAMLRQETLGMDAQIETPYGKRLLTYCDYTASGRALRFVENYLQEVLVNYANSHTEDDFTGRYTTDLLLDAEAQIKQAVNAGKHGKLIACGAGATAAINKMQQIIGVQLPPATAKFVQTSLTDAKNVDLKETLETLKPVVFVGPYEHHSNELTWRESLCEVVEVAMTRDGQLDMGDLERLLQEEKYQKRKRIGSISAASNVTGVHSPVYAIAALLHKHGALAFFDYAASAPYVEINMNPIGELYKDSWLDAIFISPHKFIGGPGSAGILVFNERCYPKDLPPSVPGGGTVTFVWPDGHDFIHGIEEREKAGTPGILQTLKAALAFAVKKSIGQGVIEKREADYTQQVIDAWLRHPNIEILGNTDPTKRIGIVSFNIRVNKQRYLHPRFVTMLLNDLFGIQTRAGCSCAGPYAHRLLGLDEQRSFAYRDAINSGYPGMRPGWCRLGIHYSQDQTEVDYILAAVDFVADRGYLFLADYDFVVESGKWIHKQHSSKRVKLDMKQVLSAQAVEVSELPLTERKKHYADFLATANQLAEKRRAKGVNFGKNLEGKLASMQYFCIAE